jgi:hypothetical protein
VGVAEIDIVSLLSQTLYLLVLLSAQILLCLIYAFQFECVVGLLVFEFFNELGCDLSSISMWIHPFYQHG